MKIWFALLLSTGLMFGAYADEQGSAIAKERKIRDSGWGNSDAQMTMILSNAQGDKSERALRIKSLEVEGDGDKGLTIFDQPLDVKGTAFLNHSHVEGADDQWLWLPALKRVKRIASQNKSGPFMGSEFSYEDLSSFELGKYHFDFIEESEFEQQAVYILEQRPVDKYSGYSKQRVWLDKTHYRPLKVDYYDRKNSLLKTLILTDYHLYQDKFWRAHLLKMDNHQTKKQTILQTHQMNFDIGLVQSDFTEASLRRAR